MIEEIASSVNTELWWEHYEEFKTRDYLWTK